MRQALLRAGLLVAVALAGECGGARTQEAPPPTILARATAEASPSATATRQPTGTPTQTIPPTATPEPPERTACDGSGPVVALVVEPGLGGLVRTGLDQFEADLCGEGYAVVERSSRALGTAEAVRAYLAELFARTGGKLAGAILVGELPHAYQWVTLKSANPSIASRSEEVISFQYYADLDGAFSASAGYVSPGQHACSFDLHQGDLHWEIWIGVLPLYKGDLARTATALDAYLAKNHAYRTGGYELPRAFLQINEHAHATTAELHQQLLDGMRVGQYAWTPFSSAPDARLYFDSPPGGLSIDQGYADLSAGVADFTVLDAHGSPPASGRLSIAWAESRPVRTAFLWDTACAAGNLDQADNVLTSLLYSPTSMVVAAEGTTADSGGFGTNADGFFGHNIATALAGGASLGDAVLAHANVPLLGPWLESRELHFAPQVILGDPTLRLRSTGAE